MNKKRKHGRSTKVLSIMLAATAAAQVAPMEAFASEPESSSDGLNTIRATSATTKWDSVGGKVQGYFIAEYGSDEPYRYIRNPGTSTAILKSPDLENGQLVLSGPEDWDIIKDNLTVTNYDPAKLGEQVITLTYTDTDGDTAVVQAHICVIDVRDNPQITSSDIEAIRSTQSVPTMDGLYLFTGFQQSSSHNNTLLRLTIQGDAYAEDGKNYVDIGIHCYAVSGTSPFAYTIKAEIVPAYNNQAPVITPPASVVLLPMDADADIVKRNTKATAYDHEDGDLTNVIVYSPVDTSQIGPLVILTRVTDSGGLSDSKNIPAAVVAFVDEIDKPFDEILPDDVVTGLDPSFEVEITDNGDGTINVKVKDKNGNEEDGTVKLVETLNENTPPVIDATGEVVLIPKGANKDTIKNNVGATATDKEDGNLTDSIIYGPLDTAITGEKNLDLSVEDSKGAIDEKTVKTSVVNIPDTIISDKEPSEVSVSDIPIEGNHQDFTTTVKNNGDGTINVTVTDRLGNNVSKNVTVINSGISTNSNFSLLERDMKGAEAVVISQTGAKAIDDDKTELAITVQGLDLTKVGQKQTVTLVAKGKNQTFTKPVTVHVVNIIEEVKAGSDGTTRQNGASLTEGAASDFKFQPETMATYKVDDKIRVTVADTYGNQVDDIVLVTGNKDSGDNNTQKPYILLDESNALLEHNDSEPKTTILNQANAIGKYSDGSKATLKVSEPKMNRIGQTQTVTISFTDPVTNEYVEEEVKVVVVDIIEELRVPADTTIADLEDWDTAELVDGSSNSMRLSHDVVNKNRIRVYVKDRYGNMVQDNVKVIYDGEINTKTNGIPMIESKPATIVLKGTAEQEVFKRLNIRAYDDEDGDLTSKVIMSYYNPNILGNQTVLLSVKDSDGNEARKEVIVEVVALSGDNYSVDGIDSDDTIIRDGNIITVIDGKSSDYVNIVVPNGNTEIEEPIDNSYDDTGAEENSGDSSISKGNMPETLPKAGTADVSVLTGGGGLLGLINGLKMRYKQKKEQKTRFHKRKRFID